MYIFNIDEHFESFVYNVVRLIYLVHRLLSSLRQKVKAKCVYKTVNEAQTWCKPRGTHTDTIQISAIMLAHKMYMVYKYLYFRNCFVNKII